MVELKGFRIFTNTKTVKINIIKKKIKRICETGKRKNAIQGYLCTRLIDDNGCSKSEMVHRLVAQAFIENPQCLPTINHINGDKHDNRVENLEWCSYSENNQHAYSTGLKNDNKILLCVDENNNIKDICYSKEFAALKNGMSIKMIYRCLKNKTKDCYGNKWLEFTPDKFSIIVNN